MGCLRKEEIGEPGGGKSRCAALMPRCVIPDMLKRREWWSEEGDGASALQSGHQRYNRNGMNTIVIRSRESITPPTNFSEHVYF
jgi:hypothetical protein